MKVKPHTISLIRMLLYTQDIADTSKAEYKEAAETLLEAYDDICEILEPMKEHL